jgi:hypothetical protein
MYSMYPQPTPTANTVLRRSVLPATMDSLLKVLPVTPAKAGLLQPASHVTLLPAQPALQDIISPPPTASPAYQNSITAQPALPPPAHHASLVTFLTPVNA